MDAAELGDEKKIRDLLVFSKNIYYIDMDIKGLDDWTALHFACNENNIMIVTVLLEHKAKVNARTNFMRTPLHFAVMRGSLELSKLLHKHGADVNVLDKESVTPLHMAS